MSNSKKWVNATDEEMHLLRENVTAPLICLKGKKWWGVDGYMPSKTVLMDPTNIKPKERVKAWVWTN